MDNGRWYRVSHAAIRRPTRSSEEHEDPWRMGAMKNYLEKFYSNHTRIDPGKRGPQKLSNGLSFMQIWAQVRDMDQDLFHGVLGLKRAWIEAHLLHQGDTWIPHHLHVIVMLDVTCHMARNLLNIEGCGHPRLVLDLLGRVDIWEEKLEASNLAINLNERPRELSMSPFMM